MIEQQKVREVVTASTLSIRSIRTLKYGYVFALSFIAFLAIINWFMVHTIIQTQTYSAAEVNTSGRQRMYSQEIAFLSLQLVESSDEKERNELRVKLLQAVEQVKVNHKGLVEGNPSMNLPPPPLPPRIYSFYFESPVNLEEKLFKYIAEVEALATIPNHLLQKENPHLQSILTQRSEMKTILDQMVNHYQVESEQEIAKLQSLEKRLLGLTLLVLLIEALFVFRPIVNTVQREQRILEDNNVELFNLSSLDGLTGIANRRTFDQFGQNEWNLTRLNEKPLAIILCDIDHFKDYNDTYGHQQGDECLKRVAQTLKETVKRREDLVARYGGEEFVVVLPNTETTGAQAVAEELRLAIASLKLKHESSLTAPFVTISVGVAVHQNSKAYSSFAELVQASDIALYQAKINGRNQVIIA